ncbi:hypothetical protein H1R20_g11798, partial [Candolleomyces eurysporus]
MATLTPEFQATLLRWQQEGPTESEREQFVDDAIAQLNDSEQVKKFQANIAEIADASMTIDKTFSDIGRAFDWIVKLLGSSASGIKGYHDQWKEFQQRWRTCLHQSIDVATDSIEFLKRFDKIYLTQVENIKTEEDRQAAIKALQEFTEEKHDGSVQMSQGFLGIKRDIEDFVRRFDQWVADQGTALSGEANQLRDDINRLQGEIESLDAKIRDAKLAMAITGGFLFFIGLAVAGGVLASLQSKRREKANELQGKQSRLEAIKAKQQLLGQAKAAFDAWKPNIALVCDKLVLFAETWASVRSQTLQFRDHIQGGLEAATNKRFKSEIKLARLVCIPLVDGLEKYKAQLQSTTNLF